MDLHTELEDLLAVPSFYKDANCKGTNQDDFFPERGSSTIIAKKICGKCKVKVQCLEYAVDRKERFGIWGGKSERERRAIRRERRNNEKESK
jgi:WhiB family redox-sensing transcriptional regulator